jgi:predicted DNA-binding ArsR family transcriptional regulator
MREGDRDRISRQGTQAWNRLKREKNWNDWIKVGEALQVGREWAMNQAMTNKPEGKGYNMAFSEWLARYKLDDMDKGDRSRLFTVMDSIGMIEDWRRTLTMTERLRLNHPNAVLRKWQKAVEPPKPDDGKPTLRDSVANLSEELQASHQTIAQLQEQISELEAAREHNEGSRTMTRHDALVNIAQILLRLNGADELVQAGSRPTDEQIAAAVKQATKLIPAPNAAKELVREELARRYTPAVL